MKYGTARRKGIRMASKYTVSSKEFGRGRASVKRFSKLAGPVIAALYFRLAVKALK